MKHGEVRGSLHLVMVVMALKELAKATLAIAGAWFVIGSVAN
jgi:hypothetical protein